MRLIEEARPAPKAEPAQYSLGPSEMLDLRLRDGRRYALPYRTLHLLAYDPEEGVLRLACSLVAVQISGAGLLPLYRELLDGNVRAVAEAETSDLDGWSGAAEPEGPWIEAIRVTELSPGG